MVKFLSKVTCLRWVIVPGVLDFISSIKKTFTKATVSRLRSLYLYQSPKIHSQIERTFQTLCAKTPVNIAPSLGFS
jgi:hypothetical protein